MSMYFSNLGQGTEEYRVDVVNLTMANSTLNEQVEMYTNRLSTKEVDNVSLQPEMENYRGR